MTTLIKTNVFRLLTLCILSSCADNDKAILNGNNFDKGDWFLVVQDYSKNTLFVIDDEKTLKDNPLGLVLGPFADCGGTTCDGFLTLYRDGELVNEHEYLSQSDVFISSDIQDAFRQANHNSIYSDDNIEFKNQWDSLSKLMNTYPTRYHTLPDDKDIIVYYTYK
jgi:hypothetical protein